MQKITLNKSGIHFSFWDEQTANWIDKNIEEAGLPLSWYLPYAIQITEEISVRDLFRILKPYRDQVELHFLHSLAGVNLEEVFVILEQASLEKRDIDPDCVILFKIGEVGHVIEEGDELNFLNNYTVLMGLELVGDEDDENNDGSDDNLHHLSEIDFKDWCDLPLGVDDYLEYVDVETEEVMFEGLVNWSLHEFISCVLSQVSITLQVRESVSEHSSKSPIESGPIQIEDLFDWIDDLDKIMLHK